VTWAHSPPVDVLGHSQCGLEPRLRRRARDSADETPGGMSYTSTRTDELVQPVGTNVVLQDLCPGRVTDHAAWPPTPEEPPRAPYAAG
jgi:hypothetical protein